MAQTPAQTSGEPPALTVVEADQYPDWEAVFRDNVIGIYQYLFRRLGNSADAEDLAEQVFIHTLRTLRLPAPGHEIRSYLIKTARTVLADHWRKHYAMPETPSELPDVANGPLPEPENQRATQRAMRILGLLPDRSRQVLELRFLRGYSVGEAAKEMGVTLANAKILQYRALRRAAQIGEELPR